MTDQSEIPMNIVTVMAVDRNAETVKWRRARAAGREYAIEEDGSVRDIPVLAAIHLVADGLATLPEGVVLPDMVAAIEAAPGDHLSEFLRAHGKQDMWFDAHKHFFSDKLRGGEELTGKDRNDIADILDSFHQQLHPSGRGGRIVVLTDDEKRQQCRDLHAASLTR